jgi:hypothetical protein
MTVEQQARDLLDRLGLPTVSLTSGDLAELANLIARERALSDSVEALRRERVDAGCGTFTLAAMPYDSPLHVSQEPLCPRCGRRYPYGDPRSCVPGRQCFDCDEKDASQRLDGVAAVSPMGYASCSAFADQPLVLTELDKPKIDYTKAPYARDADGGTVEYRRVCSVLEVRDLSSHVWREVTGEMFRRMTPAELRVVADVLEGR